MLKTAMGNMLQASTAKLISLFIAFTGCWAQSAPTTFRLDSVDGLETVGGKAEVVMYRGRKAVRLAPVSNVGKAEDVILAMVKGPDFKDGTIEAKVAGSPRSTAANERGFIGIAFRVQPHGSSYECFYLRPTNGRADDQLRRNHSTQYISMPDYPWFRLRKEDPGVYESYVDLESGAWTMIRIVVAGSKARLFVNGAKQASLIVNDLKLRATDGQVALWAHRTTDAYFSNLTIK